MSQCSFCNAEDGMDMDEGMLLCTKCGTVCQDRNVLRHDMTQNEGTSSSNTFFNVALPGLPRNFTQMLARRRRLVGMAEIATNASATTIADQLSFSKDMKLQLNALIKASFRARNWRGPLRKALAGVCVFMVMCQNEIPVTVKTVTSHLEEDCADKFTTVYYQLLKLLPDIKPGKSRYGSEFEIIMTGFKIAESERKQLFAKVKRLIDMIGEIKCLDSILSVNFVIAATYICWKSLDPSRYSVQFSNFCYRHEMDPDKLSRKTIMLRIKDIEEYLLDCTKKIPFLIRLKIGSGNIIKFLDDILKNDSCVLSDLKQDVRIKWKQQDLLFESQRASKRIKLGPSSTSATGDGHQVDEEDEYISDSEIESYIRTPEEVEMNRHLFETTISQS